MTTTRTTTTKTRERGVRARGVPVRAVGGSFSALGELAHLHTTVDIFRRGIDLYLEGRVQPTLYPSIFHIAGEGAFYRVDLSIPECGCPFWQHHNPDDDTTRVEVVGTGSRVQSARARGRAVACKHIVAAGAKAVELAGEGVV